MLTTHHCCFALSSCKHSKACLLLENLALLISSIVLGKVTIDEEALDPNRQPLNATMESAKGSAMLLRSKFEILEGEVAM